MFDTFLGLPLHPLLVHVPVVLLPLAAIAVLLLAARPRWRRAHAVPTLAVLAVGSLSTVGALLSGRRFAERVGLPGNHESLGTALMVVALLYLALAGAWLLWTRKAETPSTGQQVGGLAVSLVSLLVLVLTALTGHSGASAAWSAAGSPSPTPSASGAGYTMVEVATHDSAESCWAVVDGNVYDLTSWIDEHPGGAQRILNLCGRDATRDFRAQHGQQNDPNRQLESRLLGSLVD